MGADLRGWVEQSPRGLQAPLPWPSEPRCGWLHTCRSGTREVASAEKPEHCRTLHGCEGGDGTFPNQIRKEAFGFWPGCPQRGWGSCRLRKQWRLGETDLPGDNPTISTAPRSLFLAIDPGLDSYLETQRVEPQTL